MIFVTGDTHGLTDYAKLVKFGKDNYALTKNDYVIIAGDCGIVWSKKSLAERVEAYERLPFSVLFVDGNHENFDMLDAFCVETFCGGKVHRISEHIRHLMRGQVFEMQGKTIFTMGGAESEDRIYRTEGESWWKQETPSQEDLEEGLKNLALHGNKVDFIISHSCDASALYYPPLLKWGCMPKVNPTNMLLSVFNDNVEYKRWFFGHYHADGELNETKRALYYDILKLD